MEAWYHGFFYDKGPLRSNICHCGYFSEYKWGWVLAMSVLTKKLILLRWSQDFSSHICGDWNRYLSQDITRRLQWRSILMQDTEPQIAPDERWHFSWQPMPLVYKCVCSKEKCRYRNAVTFLNPNQVHEPKQIIRTTLSQLKNWKLKEKKHRFAT